jgi:type 2 lantibiotic biosynthesis protein LanM
MKEQFIEKQQQPQEFNICKVIEKSSSIFERLQGKFIPESSKDNEEIIKKNLEAWCQKIAKGDWQIFKQRLEGDGIEFEEARKSLGSVRLKDRQNLPDWAKILEEVVNLIPQLSKSQIEQSLANCKGIENKYSFEEILYPFVQVAREKLITKAGSSYEILTSSAVACLELNLLGELSWLASNTFYLEFSLFRSGQISSLQSLVQNLGQTHDTRIYELFVSKMLAGNLVSFLEEYAVLSRLIGKTILLWVEANAEFLNRLALDLPAIKNTFFANREIGQAIDLKLSLSEPHNGRRSVIILTFDSGDRLVYKPKNLGIDRAYFQLLEWFNQEEVLLPFKLLTLLEKQGYGWVEYVKSLPCLDQEEARRFYQRAGILLGLMYILQGVDLFYENIIACGEYPIPIDLETLMHNKFKLARNHSESYQVRPLDIIWRSSVFRTGLLPTIAVSADEKMSYDIGGLREAGQQVLPFICSAWRAVNSDAMKRDREFMKVDVNKSVPRLGDTYLRASDYTDEIVFGFKQMYRFILERKSELLAKNGPLEQFSRQKIRHILRNTKFYTSVLRSLLEPVYLRDGVQRSIEIDIVSRMYLDTGKKAVHWALVKWETEALEQMDIPFFTLGTDSIAIDLPNGEKLKGFCEKSGLDNVIDQINSLSERDLTTQVHLAESILRLSTISGKHTTTEHFKPELDIDAGEILSPLELIGEAKAIAEELKALAIYADDGSAGWIAPQLQAERYIVQPLRLDLYQGIAGVLVFLAALERVTGDSNYRELIQATALPLKDALTKTPMSTLAKNGYSIGGYTGMGSLIYAFTRIYEFLDEPTWLEDATFAASLISPDWIALDKNLDILGGAAGAILSVLTLYQKTQQPTLLETAFCCGEHLLASRTNNNQGVKGWHKIGTNFVTGFAHGAAGIAYALLRLYEFTEEKRFRNAAWDAISYEQSVFDEIAGNWPDFRDTLETNNQKKFMTAWCHGAPGIGLARIGGLSVFNTERIEKEINIALQTTRQFTRQGKDHLCCGNFGRIEVLLVASFAFGKPDLSQVATQQASWVVRRAQQRGTYNLFAKSLPGIFHPAFFQGTSGIGYQLLRLAYPDLLPSILLLS